MFLALNARSMQATDSEAVDFIRVDAIRSHYANAQITLPPAPMDQRVQNGKGSVCQSSF